MKSLFSLNLLQLPLILFSFTLHAGDWPAYRGDPRRSGISAGTLELPLQRSWEYWPAQPPTPAWPEPAVEMHRVDFDYAFQPVAAAGLVLIPSSADDTLRALDLHTGALRWQFTAAGPLRFAPQVYQNRVYTASDDGILYCLNLNDGSIVWSFRGGLNDRQVLGNERMISRWPLRAGVLVDSGIVYLAAGMWPAEGVFIYALDAQDGRIIWCNDTSGGMFMQYPHGGSLAIGGVAPQGYILAAGAYLLVPAGRSVPAVFERETGRFLYMKTGENQYSGAWWAVADSSSFFTRGHQPKEKMSVPWEKFGPRNGDGIKRYNLADGEELEHFSERHFVVSAGNILYLAGNAVVEARQDGKQLWQAAHPRVYSMIRTGNALLIGGRNRVTAYALSDGKELWQAEVPGEARGLTPAGSRLLVATHTGQIVCFAADPAATEEVEPARPQPVEIKPDAPVILPGVDLETMPGGYALVIGADRELLKTLLSSTRLQVIQALNSTEQVQTEQRYWLENSAVYGTRLAVQKLAGETLPYPDYFANLIVVTTAPAALSGSELYRVLRPCGGILSMPGLSVEAGTELLKTADIAPREINTHAGKSLNVKRGKLPGALDWDSANTADERLRWPLEITWFGGPGPARMPNRHGAVLPVPANSRYFVIGQNDLIAVDAYNGFELWNRNLPGLLNRLGIVTADDDTVYVNFGDTCLALDARTGTDKYLYHKDAVKPAGDTPLRPWAELPARALTPLSFPEIAGGDEREHPLTGDQAELAYRRAYGCGSIISSANMHFFRSATFGFYDLEDDSGIRNFSGVRPACALSMIPALGMLIANEGSGGCTCSYNLHSSFAMAPAAARSQEDWAVFYDTPAYGIIRHAALNLGAPGDRRDAERTLWLGIPRPSTGLRLGYNFTNFAGLGVERVNADRQKFENTPEPWLYSSQINGLKKLEIDLEPFLHPVSLRTSQKMEINGRLDDDCWNKEFPLEVNDEPGSSVFIRHDDQYLYFAYRRPAAVDRRGRLEPWKMKLQGENAPVWEDDSFEVTFSDQQKEQVLHLGMSAGGARYESTWTHADPYPVLDIPHLEQISVDGNPDDWDGAGFEVIGMADQDNNMRTPDNLDVNMKLGWNAKGLLLLLEVTDNAVVEYTAQAAMWRKDSIEIIMADRRGSNNRFQVCIGPGADGKQPHSRVFFWDKRPGRQGVPLTAETAGARTVDGYLVEIMFPWKNLDITPFTGQEFGLQVMVNDADLESGGARDWFRVIWHPGGHAGFRPQAMHKLRLAEKPSPPERLLRGGKPDAAGLFKSTREYDIPPLKIPRIENIVIDGSLDDWQARGFRQVSLAAQDGTMRPAAQFDPSFRLGWNQKGLLLAAEVRDKAIVTDPDPERLWRKDSIEIFMSPEHGSRESVQLILAPPKAGKEASEPVHRWHDNRGKKRKGLSPLQPLQAEVRGQRTDTGYRFEALLPWSNLGIKPETAAEIGVQIFFNDADTDAPYPGDWFRVAWYPQGNAGQNPLAFHRVQLGLEPDPAVTFNRGRRISRDLFQAKQPWPWAMPEARPAAGLDRNWRGAWRAAVNADAQAFVCELAIPWTDLENAGLDRESLILDFSRRGEVTSRPAWSYVSLNYRDTVITPPRPYTVRLHFAELRTPQPGTRVFDVILQDQKVLSNLDVVREAGGMRRPLLKEFTGVMAADKLIIEAEPAHDDTKLDWRNAPILNAVELIMEAR